MRISIHPSKKSLLFVSALALLPLRFEELVCYFTSSAISLSLVLPYSFLLVFSFLRAR